MWSFFIVLGTLMLFLNTNVQASEEWQAVPSLVLNDCIEIDKVLAPNPLSASENEFWMVLKYEERDENSGEMKALDPGRILNMYLVTGLALVASEGVGLPYYQFLIVTLMNGGSSSRVIHQWLLTDTDNDGVLDKAKFEKTETGHSGETVNSDKVEIPAEQVQSFQDFYEKATLELNSKAQDDSARQCLVS